MSIAGVFAMGMIAAGPGGEGTGRPVAKGEAAGRMTVPRGFSATLFAGEPDVRQPIAQAVDDRGRLWVVECYSYPSWLTRVEVPADRILIFEDVDHDGRFDSRKVFYEGGPNLTGIELGFGGAWVCATPDLLFIPDRDGDDAPDGPPEVVLTGWDSKAQHNMFNGLIWGPDGWLWGCNGIMSNSRVGVPGTAESARTPMNCGVWRYHPTRKTFEVVAHGTTNPWGLDFDDRGEAYITNCVIPHLFHAVPGARFERMYGQDFNPYSFDLIGSAADHLHWAGGHWTESRSGARHGEAGGGHAHSGALFYLGASWPAEYRGSVLTCNIHGNRINRDVPRPEGSGWAFGHAPDLLKANDPWFRGISLKAAPDGSVFVIDWSDTDECHDTDSNGPERETGRIYKVAYGTPKPAPFDPKATDSALAALHAHGDDWHVRHARRLLQERSVGRPIDAGAVALLERSLASDPDDRRRLRALWALNAIGRTTTDGLLGLLDDAPDDVRAWAVRLLARESRVGRPTAAALALLAAQTASARVRLQLASALQAVDLDDRWPIASNLAGRGEDADDAMIPAMIWYGVEPLAAADGPRAVALAATAKIPSVRRKVARRVVLAGDGPTPGAAALVAVLAGGSADAVKLDLLDGMAEALRGRRSAPMPPGWVDAARRLAASPSGEVRERAMTLSLVFASPGAVEAVRALVLDRSADAGRRARALAAMVDRRPDGLAADLRGLLDDPAIRSAAIRSLAAVDDPATPGAILARYGSMGAADREAAVATLASRPGWASALLGAVDAGAVPRRDVSTAIARQILGFKDAPLAAALAKSWGVITPTSANQGALTRRYKDQLTGPALAGADASRGRALYARSCGQCHRLFDAGGDLGPELTGSDRANVDYILGNVLDPSGVVQGDYRMTTVATTDGRLISGRLREQAGRSIVVQTTTERLILPRDEVESITPSSVSMMPEGLFEAMTPGEVADLILYLKAPAQVPLPAGDR